jgi:hypothetical protein
MAETPSNEGIDDALYFFNMNELACSDLNAGDRLEIDPDFPYRSNEPSELDIETRRIDREARIKEKAAEIPGSKSLPCFKVECPACGAKPGKPCEWPNKQPHCINYGWGRRKVSSSPVHFRRWLVSRGLPDVSQLGYETMSECDQQQMTYWLRSGNIPGRDKSNDKVQQVIKLINLLRSPR